jgi:predicted O-methyltransferase YrrM
MPQYPAQDEWVAVEAYMDGLFMAPDPALKAALRDSDAAGLPPHAVTPSQGKLLHLLARLIGARDILEIGTLGGYSTIWFARALADGGKVVTLEAAPLHAEVARRNIARAGMQERVDLRLGPAAETMAALIAEDRRPFDLILIDADKCSNPTYFELSLQLARPGTLIVADNVVRDGTVLEADSADDYVRGVRRFNEMVAADSRVVATCLQTVSGKGWDGMTFLLVTNR